MSINPLRAVFIIAVCATVFVCAAGPAAAQDTVETTTTSPSDVGTGTGPTDTTETDDGEAGANGDGNDNRWLAFTILLFGGAVVGALLWYVRWAQEKYFEAVRTLIAWGMGVPQPFAVPALAVPSVAEIRAIVDEALPSLRIEGDAVVVAGVGQTPTAVVIVGTPTEFKALGRPKDADADAPVAATWTVSPSEGAALEAGGKTGAEVVGEAVKLVAKTKGVFTLQAAADKFNPATLTVIAIAAPAETPRIPYVGSGYGTIMIAVVILTVAGVLGVVGALASEAVATLFGAVAGFIFLKGAQSNGDSAPPSGGQQTTSTTTIPS
jgi:hypothetical protein